MIAAIIPGGCGGRQRFRTTPQMDIAGEFWVRVLLLDDVRDCTLKANNPFSVIDSRTQTTLMLWTKPACAAITVKNGQFVIDDKSLSTNEITVAPEKPYVFNLNGADYRGKLKLVMNADGESFDAINHLPVGPYLAGVVGAEMPDYWEPQALKAQAIAARTYCLYIKKRFGGGRNWDLRQTAAHQVYRGVSAESKRTWRAVEKTVGQVLICRQQSYIKDIFPTYYSSACGGHTENSQNVFGDSFEPLGGAECPYCESVAKPQIFFWPMITMNKSEITAKLSSRYPKLKSLGQIKDIRIKRKSDYDKFSRPTMAELIGENGKSDSIRAEDLRLTLDPSGMKLRSTTCQIVNLGEEMAFLSGRGYGHGVGMCQCGAQGMARKGFSAEQILIHYYPGSEIRRIY